MTSSFPIYILSPFRCFFIFGNISTSTHPPSLPPSPPSLPPSLSPSPLASSAWPSPPLLTPSPAFSPSNTVLVTCCGTCPKKPTNTPCLTTRYVLPPSLPCQKKHMITLCLTTGSPSLPPPFLPPEPARPLIFFPPSLPLSLPPSLPPSLV